MPIVTLKELIEAGVHFGSPASRWNPKMKPYIHSKRNKIHIINLRETLKGLIRSYHFLKQVAANGKSVLFVGTKRQAADIIRQEATRSNSYFVASRWLGGTLTNMQTMRNRILRLEELESLEKNGELQKFSKKMISSLTRERKKIFRNFEGTRNMKDLPGAVVVIDPLQEKIAVAEAVKLNIPVIGIADTESDPDLCDFVIPGNDDSFRSIHCIIGKLNDAIIEGRKKGAEKAILAGGARPGKKDENAAGGASEDKGIEDLPQDFSKVGGFSYGDDK